jgi:hypothetical protein
MALPPVWMITYAHHQQPHRPAPAGPIDVSARRTTTTTPWTAADASPHATRTTTRVGSMHTLDPKPGRAGPARLLSHPVAVVCVCVIDDEMELVPCSAFNYDKKEGRISRKKKRKKEGKM